MAYNDTDKHEAQTSVVSGNAGVEFGWDIIAPRSEDCVMFIPIGLIDRVSNDKINEICNEGWRITRHGVELIAKSFDS